MELRRRKRLKGEIPPQEVPFRKEFADAGPPSDASSFGHRYLRYFLSITIYDYPGRIHLTQFAADRIL